MLNADLIKGARGAAEYTGLSERAIYHLVEAHRLPTVRLGRTLYFRRSELDAVFTSREVV